MIGFRSTPPGVVTFLAVLLAASLAMAQQLSVDDMQNARYVGIYDQPVTLIDGRYVGPPYGEDTPGRPEVTFLERGVRFGDLDGDGDEDAIALLIESGGGTGRFLHVAAFLNDDGEATNIATLWIGDRIPVRDAAVRDGRIDLGLVVEGPGDAACCKFSKERWTVDLVDDELIVTSRVAEGRVGLDDLDGTRWRLIELGRESAVLPGVPVTLEVRGGRLLGSAGCNAYQAAVVQDPTSEFATEVVVGPVLSTRMMCEPLVVAQEDEFLAKLESAYLFGYDTGDLVLRYASMGGGVDHLRLERDPTPAALIGTPWLWTEYADPVVGTTAVTEGDSVLLRFGQDGFLAIDGGCLQGTATFSAEGSGMRIDAQSISLDACPAGAPVRRLVRDLPWVRLVSISDDSLRLELFADGGTLTFERADRQGAR